MNGPRAVAHAAPLIPRFKVYIKIGSRIMLIIAASAIGRVALLTSPSALNAPPTIGGINSANVHVNIINP